MKPYYKDQHTTIYHGDSRDVLPGLELCDLIVTDPPYGVGIKQKTWAKENGRAPAPVLYDDSPDEIKRLVQEFIPVMLSSAKRAIVFPGPAMIWYYPPAASLGCVYSPSPAGRSYWGFQGSHPILYYGADPYLAAGLGGRTNSFTWNQASEQFDHPTPKPIKWMRWAIMRGSIEKTDVILDPFMGSGTTLRAAKDLNRRAIGIEIEERYCEIAVKRMAQDVMVLE